MEALAIPGVVVYSPAETEDHRIINVRLESQGSGKPLIESVFGGALTRARFDYLLKSAGQPLAAASRTELRGHLMPKDPGLDAGKRLFFKDLDFYGLLPKALGGDNAITIGSNTVQTALKNRRSLEGVRVDPPQFSGFMGYPENEADLAAVFGNQKSARLATWKDHADTLRSMAEEFGFRLFSGSDFRTSGSNAELLAEMEKASGIIFVLAHSEGCHFSVPGGTGAVHVTPTDIANLHLGKAPFVVLRICDGIDNGYASAFMRAGARGVWANRGVVSAKVANEQIGMFLKFTSEGDSVLEAVRRVDELNPAAKASAALFAQLIPLK